MLQWEYISMIVASGKCQQLIGIINAAPNVETGSKPIWCLVCIKPTYKTGISCCDRWHILYNIVDQFTAIYYNLQPVGIFLPRCYMYLIKFSWHLRHTLTTTQCVKKRFNCHMLKKILTFLHFPTIYFPHTGTYGQYDVQTADIDQFPLISMAQIRVWVFNRSLWTKHQLTNIDEIE